MPVKSFLDNFVAVRSGDHLATVFCYNSFSSDNSGFGDSIQSLSTIVTGRFLFKGIYHISMDPVSMRKCAIYKDS